VTEPTQFWWTVRTHHSYGTLEVRIADAQPRLEESMAVAGLIVGLTAALMARYDREGRLPVHEGRFIEENRWRALRDGLDGRLIDLDRRVEVPAVDAVRSLVAQVEPLAATFSLEDALGTVERMLTEGNSAQRQLRMVRDGMSLEEVHRLMVRETMGSVAG